MTTILGATEWVYGRVLPTLYTDSDSPEQTYSQVQVSHHCS